jgi:hypothetical protein
MDNTQSISPGFRKGLFHLLFVFLVIPPVFWIFGLSSIMGFDFSSIGWKEFWMGGSYAPGVITIGMPIYWISLIICYVIFLRKSRNSEFPMTTSKKFRLALLYPNIVYLVGIPLALILKILQ